MKKLATIQTVKRFGKYVDSIESSRKIMSRLGIDKELIDKWTHKVGEDGKKQDKVKAIK